jgi:hypothetical protein
MKKGNDSKDYLLYGIWLFFIIVSCSSHDYSTLVGQTLELPKSIRNSRIELRNSGTRMIFWINQDFSMNEYQIDQFILELESKREQDFSIDIFILANQKMEDKLTGLIKKAPVKVYLIDEKRILFYDHKKQTSVLPSCVFLTTNDYVIQSINKLDQ